MIHFKAILHASYIVKNIQVAEHFYCTILGMTKNSARPGLPYAGLWLDIGASQIHLLELENPDTTTGRPEHGGRDRHVALQVDSINSIADVLKSADIGFSLSHSGRKALFCRDPDGNALEFIEQ